LLLYLDTSVFGGVFDEEFSDDSSRLVDYVRKGKVRIFMSRMVLIEIESAPEHVKKLVHSLPREQIRRCSLKKSKDFDCVQMKNDIQARMYEEIKDLHGIELIDYLKDKIAQSSFADWSQGGDTPDTKSHDKVA